LTEKRKMNPGGILLIVLAAMLLLQMWSSGRSAGDVSYYEMKRLFEQEKVQEFQVDGTRLEALLKDGEVATCELYDFELFYQDMNDLVEQQAQKGIIQNYDYYADNSVNWLQQLLPYVMMVLCFLFLLIMMNRMMGGGAQDKMARFGEARVVIGAQPIVASVVQLLMSAVVAGLTVGGKAFGKSIAMNNSTVIIHTAAKIIHWFKSMPAKLKRMFRHP